MTPLVVLELFAGSGGLAEGLRRAGIVPSMAFERDGDACESYDRNLGLQTPGRAHRPSARDRPACCFHRP
jgi:site-specific DNA-cytosine methylase